MKNRILLLLLIMVFACKEEKTQAPKELTVKNSIVKSFSPIDMKSWTKKKVSLDFVAEVEFNELVYHLKRTSKTESAYLSSPPIAVNYASVYRISIIVKKAENTNNFGLRLSGSYPDRVDAIFNLENGTIIDKKASRDFEFAEATIESLTDGWYKCTLKAEVAADNIKIVIGGTDLKRTVISWEGKTENLDDVYIVPSSIVLEEIILN